MEIRAKIGNCEVYYSEKQKESNPSASSSYSEKESPERLALMQSISHICSEVIRINDSQFKKD